MPKLVCYGVFGSQVNEKVNFVLKVKKVKSYFNAL